MIKLEHCVLPSPEQMVFIIESMRNTNNSWDRTDSETYAIEATKNGESFNVLDFMLGKKDHQLMNELAIAGPKHREYMRMMSVYVRITAPLYWWEEFDDIYKDDIVVISCDTMYKITEKEFTRSDFSLEHLSGDGCIPDHDYQSSTYVIDLLIESLNFWRNEYLTGSEGGTPKDKRAWWQMIQLLPSSYNQTRNVMMNYEVLANIYKSCKDLELDEWHKFCEWIEYLPWSELICQWEEEIPTESGWKADCMNIPVEK